jgi:serine/threonine-protein kinase
MLDKVFTTSTGVGEVHTSRDGTLVYRGGTAGAGLATVQWMDSSGRLQPLLSTPGNYGRFSLSPAGERLAIEAGDTNDIWIYDLRRENLTRLTTVGSTLNPVWTPDGRYIVYQDPEGGIGWVRSDGGQPQALIKSTNAKQQWPWAFSSDGKRLGFFQTATGGYDLWTVPVEADSAGGIRAGKPESFYSNQFDLRAPAFSPDGHWIAYSSNESGVFEVYIRSFPDKGGRQQISNGGGSYPMWSRGASELFYETLDNHIMRVSYAVKGDSFVAEKPRLWSEKAIGGAVNNIKNVGLSPDGKRIVALMPVQSQEAQTDQNHVTFLLNFFDEVQRRAGGQGK